jgi:uncharacterized protein (UPF0276 family)
MRRMRELDGPDRVGLGWRPELAAGIFAHLDRIDVVEVIADDHFRASRAELRALCTLAAQVPVVLHGVSLGLASTEPVDERRLDRLARVVGEVGPELWSEHFAFVRGGGVEIGHLAAPPRTAETVDGTARNVARARAVVGTAPVLENVASLVDPLGDRSEADWLADAAAAADVDLLLDLHNLYANARNFRFDAAAFIEQIPLGRVRMVHLSGGRWITAAGVHRLLDDHLHDPPDAVYALLVELARRAPHPLTVIVERDGEYPRMEVLLAQLDRARAALADGRQARITTRAKAARDRSPCDAALPERALARLYVEDALRRRLGADTPGVARDLALTGAQAGALSRLDRADLELAAHSFARKRNRT